MSLPALPAGYVFKVKSFDGTNAVGIPLAGTRFAVRVSILDSATGATMMVEYIDASTLKTQAAFTAAVDAKATTMASDFTQAQDLKVWTEANYPDA